VCGSAGWVPAGAEPGCRKGWQLPPGQRSEGVGSVPWREGSCLQTDCGSVSAAAPAQRKLDHGMYKEMPRELGLFGFQRLKEKLLVVFYGLTGGQQENRAGNFWVVTSSGRSSNTDTSCSTRNSDSALETLFHPGSKH